MKAHLLLILLLTLPLVSAVDFTPAGNIKMRGYNITNASSICLGSDCVTSWSSIGGGNSSWNQTLADTLYSPIGAIGGNSSWNETRANTLYAPIATISYNTSWNETGANALYSPISEPLWSGNKSLYLTLSSYNANSLGFYNVSNLPSFVTATNGTHIYNNISLLTNRVASIGNWSADKTSYATVVQLQAQDTCSEITGCVVGAITDGNTNWDNSYGFITSYAETDPLWSGNASLYYLKSNPFGFYNSSTMPAVAYQSSAAGWTNTSTETSTSLIVNATGNIYAGNLYLGQAGYGTIYPKYGRLWIRRNIGETYPAAIVFQDMNQSTYPMLMELSANGTSSGTYLRILNSSVDPVITYTNQGWLGISRLVPTQALEVNGNGNFSGPDAQVWVNGSLVCTAANGLCAGNASWNQSHANTLYAPITTISDNTSWNETRASTLYVSISNGTLIYNNLTLYYLKTNPYSFYNSSTLPAYPTGDNKTWNQTLGDSLYYPKNTNPLGFYNVSTLPASGGDNTSWNETRANTLYVSTNNGTLLYNNLTLYYLKTNPFSFYNSSTIPSYVTTTNGTLIYGNLSTKLSSESDPLWSGNQSLYYLKSNPFGFYNSSTLPASGGDNATWNESYANTLYWKNNSPSLRVNGTLSNFTVPAVYIHQNYTNSTNQYRTLVVNISSSGESYSSSYPIAVYDDNTLVAGISATGSLYGQSLGLVTAYIDNFAPDISEYITFKDINANPSMYIYSGTIPTDNVHLNISTGTPSNDVFLQSQGETNSGLRLITRGTGKTNVSGTLVAANITLQNNCADGQILKWSGGVGKCGTDETTAGGGDGTGGWTNTSTNTSTNLNVVVSTINGAPVRGPVRSANYFFTDFMVSGTQQIDFGAAVISSGTTAEVAMGTGEENHPGIVSISDSTTANGGYRYYSNVGGLRLNNGTGGYIIFKPGAVSTANWTIIMGFHDTTTSALPTDGCFFYTFNNNLNYQARCRNNNAETSSTTNISLVTGYFYKATIDVVNSSLVTFRMYNSTETATGLAWETNITSNIPFSSGRETGFGVIGTQSTTAAGQVLLNLDAMAWWYNNTIVR